MNFAQEPTRVLPTARAIRRDLLNLSHTDRFLPRYLSMGELLERAVVVADRHRPDEDERTLTLLEASDFNHFKALQIERNFFTFTQNSSYFFRFFEELSGELVALDALEQADVYGDFAEHLAILAELRRRYETLCESRGILERIFLPTLYSLNRDWIQTHPHGFAITVEGYLTNFELALLRRIAEQVPVVLTLTVNAFNAKLAAKFEAFESDSDPALSTRGTYRIDLQAHTATYLHPLAKGAEVSTTPFGERTLQVAFVKQCIAQMVGTGIDPERIAVVTPDESFAAMLRRFDDEDYFNYAMGIPLSESRFVGICDAFIDYAEDPVLHHKLRLERIFKTLPEWLAHYDAPTDRTRFDALIAEWLLLENDAAVREKIEAARFDFGRLIDALHEAPLKAWLHLFVRRLKALSLDDVGGGKITVMGVLETRGCDFDGVILVDFNEDNVPHRSEKDLFINSRVRRAAGLPDTQDREDLQKFFYARLIERARRVAISYVVDETRTPSRFLRELGIEPQMQTRDARWSPILFHPHPARTRGVPEIEANYDFAAAPLSSTAFETFLRCRRRFYHRYVERIREHELPKEEPDEPEIGESLHRALGDVFSARPLPDCAPTLRAEVAKALARIMGEGEMVRYLQRLWLQKLTPFFEQEAKRLEQVEVVGCEIPLACDIHGIRLEGRIDRIDKEVEGLLILDYKTGKIRLDTERTVEQTTNYQMQFYTLLAAPLGPIASCSYYDLNSATLLRESLHEEKMVQLMDHLDYLKRSTTWRFDLTEERAHCRFCGYAYLCQRAG